MMKQIIYVIGLMFFLCGALHGQSLKIMNEQVSAYRLETGDTLLVQKPSVAIDSVTFHSIESNLKNYASLQALSKEQRENFEQVVSKLYQTMVKVEALVENAVTEEEHVLALKDELIKLQQITENLDQTNSGLSENNAALNENIQELQATNKELRKEIRAIRLRNIRNYIIVGVLGVGIGLVL